MTKPRIRLRIVPKPEERPLAPLTRAEKLASAIAFLRERGAYVLDKGARRPSWGVPGSPRK